MNAPTKRPWDPNAPSILWAHELRRENIQLVNEMDKVHVLFSSTANTIDHLRKNVDLLSEQVNEQHLQRERDKNDAEARFQELERALETKFGDRLAAFELQNAGLRDSLDDLQKVNGALMKRVEELEKQNGIFMEKLAALESGSSELRIEVQCAREGVSTLKAALDEDRQEHQSRAQRLEATLDEERRENEARTRRLESSLDQDRRENDTRTKRLEATFDKDRQEREVKARRLETKYESQDRGPIPNSLSTVGSESASVSPMTGFSARASSETTWGSASDLDRPYGVDKDGGNRHPQRKEAHENQEKGLDSLRQNGRTLAEYLSYAETLRANMPSVNDGRVREKFLLGLDDYQTRKEDKQRIASGSDGGSWETLVSAVRGIVGKETELEGKRVSAGNSAPPRQRKEARKRRHIPIIPIDEEDASIAASMAGPGGG